jgi:hypothetical protein
VSGRFLRISARRAGAFLKKDNINVRPRIASAGPLTSDSTGAARPYCISSAARTR